MDALSSMDGKSIEVGRFHDGLPGGDPGCHQVAVDLRSQTHFAFISIQRLRKGKAEKHR